MVQPSRECSRSLVAKTIVSDDGTELTSKRHPALFGAPCFEHGACMRERAKQGLVEQLVAPVADEGFHEGVLHRFAGRDAVRSDLVIVGPAA